MLFYLLAIFVQYHSHAIHTYTSDEARPHGSLYNSCGCSGCIKPNCGLCRMCLYMPKFGGPGKRKKKCQQRVCVASTKKNSVLIMEGDFNTLLIPSAWFSDKVSIKSFDYLKNKQLVCLYHQFSCIDCYFKLLSDVCKRHIHAFSCHFYPTLVREGSTAVTRWIKKINTSSQRIRLHNNVPNKNCATGASLLQLTRY